jgi:hypothetical protein
VIGIYEVLATSAVLLFPINKFLPSLSCLFTHIRPDANSDVVRRGLARLSGAPHVNKDPELRDLVRFLDDYFTKSFNCCLLHPHDIASPSPTQVAARRRQVLDLILQSVPLSQELTSTLGCPLSSESQMKIREKCEEIEVPHASLHLELVT